MHGLPSNTALRDCIGVSYDGCDRPPSLPLQTANAIVGASKGINLRTKEPLASLLECMNKSTLALACARAKLISTHIRHFGKHLAGDLEYWAKDAGINNFDWPQHSTGSNDHFSR